MHRADDPLTLLTDVPSGLGVIFIISETGSSLYALRTVCVQFCNCKKYIMTCSIVLICLASDRLFQMLKVICCLGDLGSVTVQLL